MCLVLLSWDFHPQYSLILAANRDEFYDRPTAPAAFWEDAPSLLGGRDYQAGGTWLGIDRRGRFAAVTNFRQGQRETEAPRSRGQLVSDFLRGDATAAEHMERVAEEASVYNGFNLLAGDSHGLYYFSNREGVVRRLERGIYGLSNHLLDTPWPKVISAKSALQALQGSTDSQLTSGLFALLSDQKRADDHLLPTTGIGREWEQLLSSAFIATKEYGTRSSTVILVDRKGGGIFIERSFGPGGSPAGEARFDLRFDLRRVGVWTRSGPSS
jgi:uncharacterized protein with NRDE domain